MTPGSCSLPALALCAALLLVGTEGHVRGIDSSDTGGQQGGTESRINAKSLMTLIRMLVTRNDVGADVEGQSKGMLSRIPKEMTSFWSDRAAIKRSDDKTEQDLYPLAPTVQKRTQGSDQYTDENGEHLSPTDFSNAAKISNEIDERPEGAADPTENHDIKDADFFEGDIVHGHPERQGRNMIRDDDQKWLRGEIPYVIASGFNTDERATIAKAVLEFERNTCIRVRPLGPTDDASQGYVRIIKGDGCYSSVGRQVSSPGQELSLGNGCLFPGIVVHEFMHAIGFWHEQSRPDRDSHVMIHYDNIKYGKDYNFKKYTTNEVQLKGTPYDVGSIMHYGPYAFARNRNQPTISALKQTSVTMGQREGLSHYDIQKINTLYGCKDVTKPPPPITKPEKCTDRNMYCKDWAAAGECGKNPLYMNIYCAKSCDKCSDKSCEDLNELCPKWAETGECAATPSYMTLYCKKSCDLCDGNGGMVCNNVNGYCEAWAEMGECDKNPDYMHGSCRKACKLC